MRQRITHIPIRFMFESALELMSETKVGNFEMKGSGGKAAGPPAPIKVGSRFHYYSPIHTHSYLHPLLSTPTPIYTHSYVHPLLSTPTPIYTHTPIHTHSYLHPLLSTPTPIYTYTYILVNHSNPLYIILFLPRRC